MEQSLISTFIQLGAFGVLAYLVIRWQRDDLAEGRKSLIAISEKYDASASKTADHLQLVAQTLGTLCGKVDDLADHATK
jgi:hypothetical protein